MEKKQFNIDELLKIENCICDASCIDDSESLSIFIEEHYGIDFDDWVLKNMTYIKDGVDVLNRWQCDTAVTIYEIGGRFIGVRGISNTHSDWLGYEDCDEKFSFIEYDEIITTDYKVKGV